MTDAATRAQRYLACLSDPSRFRLLLALGAGDRCVTELAQAVGLSQSCTTRHLQALEREEAVESVRQGKRVVYRIRGGPDSSHPVLRWALRAASDVEGDVTWGSASIVEGDGSPVPTGVRGEPAAETARPRSPRRRAVPAANSPGPAAGKPGSRRPGGADLHGVAPFESEGAWMHSDGPAMAGDLDSPSNPVPAGRVGDQPETEPAPILRRDLDDFLL